MHIQIGLIHSAFGIKRGLEKNVETIEEAREVIQKILAFSMEQGWIPGYCLIDGEQRMKKLTNDTYEIEV